MSINRKVFNILITLSILMAPCSHVVYGQSKVKKEVSREIQVHPNATLRIQGSYSKIIIRKWDFQKVKINCEFYHDDTSRHRTDEEWIEDLGTSIRSFNNRIEITGNLSAGKLRTTPLKVSEHKKSLFIDGVKSPKMPKMPADLTAPAAKASAGKAAALANKQALQHARKEQLQSKMEAKHKSIAEVKISKGGPQVLYVYVPVGTKVEIDNKYGDVIIDMDLTEAKLDIQNGKLETQDIKEMRLQGKSCNAHLGTIDDAEIEIENGSLRARDINKLDLDSKSSVIDYDRGTSLYLRSNTDEINIEEMGDIGGRKTYGNLRINLLKGNVDLEGHNADIKFRSIDPQVEKIRINNKYADMRLPVRGLTNYYVDFSGNYATIFAPFEKQEIQENTKEVVKPAVARGMSEAQQEKAKKTIEQARQGEKPDPAADTLPTRFISSNGDVKGKHTRFELICTACTVDFK